MSQRFTTEVLPASDRIDAWRWNAEQICGDCRIKLPKSSFHGSIEVRTVGGLRLTRFRSSPLAFWKWPADVVNLDNRACVVITQLSGVRTYLQNGISVVLKPGDSTIIDSGRPWCSTCTTDCTRLYLRVPRWMMENRLRQCDIPIARRICGSTGLGATLFRLSQSLYEEAEHFSEQEGTAALDGYFGILGGCIGGEALAPTNAGLQHSARHSYELRGRIQQFIDAHLSEPTLDPAEIASALSISVRHLHRLFAGTGNTVGDYVRSRRLEECRNDLANPRLQDRTITDIAFCWGFSDSAHFSHSFTREFGISPRTFRAKAARENYAAKYLHVRHMLRTDAVGLRCARPN